jgi:hypothetical protein
MATKLLSTMNVLGGKIKLYFVRCQANKVTKENKMDTFARCPNCRTFCQAKYVRRSGFFECDKCGCYFGAVDDFYASIVAKRLTETLGTDTLILHIWEEGEYNTVDHFQSWSIARCLEDIIHNSWYEEGNVLEIQDLHDLTSCLEDAFGNCDGAGLIAVRTPQQQQDHEQEEKRKRLESYASQFASEKGVPVDSIEMLQKIEQEINRTKEDCDEATSGEARFMHGCACVADLYGIQEWIQTNCPLLWARFVENTPLS